MNIRDTLHKIINNDWLVIPIALFYWPIGMVLIALQNKSLYIKLILVVTTTLTSNVIWSGIRTFNTHNQSDIKIVNNKESTDLNTMKNNDEPKIKYKVVAERDTGTEKRKVKSIYIVTDEKLDTQGRIDLLQQAIKNISQDYSYAVYTATLFLDEDLYEYQKQIHEYKGESVDNALTSTSILGKLSYARDGKGKNGVNFFLWEGRIYEGDVKQSDIDILKSMRVNQIQAEQKTYVNEDVTITEIDYELLRDLVAADLDIDKNFEIPIYQPTPQDEQKLITNYRKYQ